MPLSVHARTFRKAAELAGGLKQLSRELRLPMAELEKWIADREPPPMASFLKAVDFVLAETSSTGSAEPSDPPAAHDCAAEGGSYTA